MHYIDKILFDIEIGQQSAAPALQQRVSAFSRTRLELALERGLSWPGAPAGPLVFGRLELDLGEVSLSVFEGQLAERITERLRDALARHAARLQDPAWRALSEQPPEAAAAQPALEALGALGSFLEQGHVPANVAYDPGRAIATLCERAPAALRALLERLGVQYSVRKRMAGQLSDAVLEAVVRLLEPAHADLVLSCAREIGLAHRQSPVLPQDARGLRRAVWEFILAYLLVERGSYFNTRAFSASLLRQMAARYHVGYGELLSALIDSVDVATLPFSARATLPAMLAELHAELGAPPRADDGAAELNEYARQLRDAAAFLEFGMLTGVARRQALSPDALLDGLAQQQPDALRALLRELGGRAPVRQRLAGQLGEPVLVRLVHVLEPAHAGPMVSHMRSVRRQAAPALAPQDSAGFGRVLWQLVFDYLLLDRGSHFNRRSFVHGLLLGVAARYRMRYQDVLAAVVAHLPARRGQSTSQDSLAGILFALSDALWLGADPGAALAAMGMAAGGRTPGAAAPQTALAAATLHIELVRLLRDGGLPATPPRAGSAMAQWLAQLDDATTERAAREIGPDCERWMRAAGRLPAFFIWRVLRLLGGGLGVVLAELRQGLTALMAPHAGSEAAQARAASYLIVAMLRPAAPSLQDLLRTATAAACARFGLPYRAELMRMAARTGSSAVLRAACASLLLEAATAPDSAPAEASSSASTAAATATLEDELAVALHYLRHGVPPPSCAPDRLADLRALLRTPAQTVQLLRDGDLRPDMIRRLLTHAPAQRLLALLAALDPAGLVQWKAFLHGRAVTSLHWLLLFEALLDPHAPRQPAAELQAALEAQIAARSGGDVASRGLPDNAPTVGLPQSGASEAGQDAVAGRMTWAAAGAGRAAQQDISGLAVLQVWLRSGALPMALARCGRVQALHASFTYALQQRREALRAMLLQSAGSSIERARLAAHTPVAMRDGMLQLLLGASFDQVSRLLGVLRGLPGQPWRESELLALLLAEIHRRHGRRFDAASFLQALLRTRPTQGPRLAEALLHRLHSAFDGRHSVADKAIQRQLRQLERHLALTDGLPDVPAPKPPKRPPAEAQAELPEGTRIMVGNAGMVLLWPFLERFFEGLDMLSGGAFKDAGLQSRAVYLLQYLASGSAAAPESDLALNKVMCGLDPAAALTVDAADSILTLREDEQSLADRVLHAVTQNWPKLHNTTSDVLRSTFLMREGVLRRHGDGWSLAVAGSAFDPLLQFLPWGLSAVRLPWMAHMLWVEWKR